MLGMQGMYLCRDSSFDEEHPTSISQASGPVAKVPRRPSLAQTVTVGYMGCTAPLEVPPAAHCASCSLFQRAVSPVIFGAFCCALCPVPQLN